ncbi:hypothetical protein BaRGS_00031026 [Batillaria attramentaria]|uniref:Uncharacterized protein n=1 Tax=Batillaria attramentaria TaxID=370345 RepID=A0ABD0JSC0_9CAEN
MVDSQNTVDANLTTVTVVLTSPMVNGEFIHLPIKTELLTAQQSSAAKGEFADRCMFVHATALRYSKLPHKLYSRTAGGAAAVHNSVTVDRARLSFRRQDKSLPYAEVLTRRTSAGYNTCMRSQTGAECPPPSVQAHLHRPVGTTSVSEVVKKADSSGWSVDLRYTALQHLDTEVTAHIPPPHCIPSTGTNDTMLTTIRLNDDK